jgi:prepilin-type N-terminal cleavage/methylation domain-containing protein
MKTRPTRGFTLVEVLIATALGSLVLATVASLSVYGARSSMAIANYTDLDSKSRYALDVIGREIRQATAVTGFQTNATGSYLTLTNAQEGAAVTLTYDPVARTLVMAKTGATPLTALTQCDNWSFSLYQRTPYGFPTNLVFYPATNTAGALDLSICKVINMNWKCSRQILQQKINTESVQTAQIVLRNKP